MSSTAVAPVLARRLEGDDAVLVVTLNRPERRNALDAATFHRLGAILADAAGDRSVRALVVEGEGPAFCAGLDHGLLMQAVAGAGDDPAGFRRGLADLQSQLAALEALPQPVVCALHGPCIGSGLELALACDVRVADLTASLQLPEIRVGLIPDLGGTTRLARLCGPGVAADLVMSARTVGASEARLLGLVSAVGEDARALARERARELAAAAPLAVGWAKRVIQRAVGAPLEDGLALEREAMAELIATDDMREGVAAAVARREPRFEGR
jgi:enoyl-CoA hydratase/carnithine racemase